MNKREVARAVATQVVANINAGIFLIGAVLLFVGLAEYSHALAKVVLGALMIVLAAWPYLIAMKRAGR